MPQLAGLLKAEITRLARREIKKEIATLHKASARHRRDLAALKRALGQLEKHTKNVSRAQTKLAAPPEQTDGSSLRFRVAGFKALRARLGLSASDMGRLIGVSGQSIYAWEQEKSAPRRSQLPAIAAVRAMGKRKVAQRLAT